MSTATLDTTTVRRWKRYPKYRASGADWHPEVPASWQVRRIKFLAGSNPSKTELSGLADDTLVSFVPMEQVSEDGVLSLELTRPLREVRQGFTYFRNGDVLVAKITPCFENGKGARADCLENGIGFGTTEFHVLRPNSAIDGRYLELITRLHPFREQGVSEMTGSAGQQRVPESFLSNYLAPLPPLAEQRAIVAFLDRETARIDALIGHKERLIALLEEKRQAVISHAVAGEVSFPEVRLKHYTDILPGFAFPSEGFSKEPEDVRLLRGTNVVPGATDWSEVVYWPKEDAAAYREYELQTGDLVFGMDRPWIKSGIRVARISPCDLPCLLLQRVARLRAKEGLSQDYLELLLGSGQFAAYFEPILTGVSVPHISPDQILDFRFRLPPCAVQSKTARRLSEHFASLSRTTVRIRDGIARLQEYRTALISAAVTGQIDVRGEV